MLARYEESYAMTKRIMTNDEWEQEYGKKVPKPVATITIQLFSSASGQGEVQIWADPQGEFGPCLSKDAPTRQQAYSALVDAAVRELRDAVSGFSQPKA
jgi:hypothetical protein